MLTVPEYVNHVKETVFPQALQKLEQCADAAAVARWKKVVCQFINEKRVAGEPAEEFMIKINPQDEERKENLSTAERVYLSAHHLETSVINVNLAFKEDIAFFQ